MAISNPSTELDLGSEFLLSVTSVHHFVNVIIIGQFGEQAQYCIQHVIASVLHGHIQTRGTPSLDASSNFSILLEVSPPLPVSSDR